MNEQTQLNSTEAMASVELRSFVPPMTVRPPAKISAPAQKTILPTVAAVAVFCMAVTASASVLANTPMFAERPLGVSQAGAAASSRTLAANVSGASGSATAQPQAGTVAGLAATTSAASSQPVYYVYNYPVIERVVETQKTLSQSGVTQEELSARLQELSNKLVSQLYSITSVPSSLPATGGVTNNVALSQRIDNLSNVTLRNPTIIGGTISGTSGIGSGGVSLSDSNTWSALQIFSANASSTNFSNFGTAYFGGSATSTFDSSGALTLAVPLATSSGGTGISTYAIGDLLYVNSSGALARLPVGSSGQVVKVAGGVPAWGADLQGSGGAGAWATSTDSLLIYPATPSNVVVVGASATTTTGKILEVTGNSLFTGTVSAGTTTVNSIISTNTSTSTFAGGVETSALNVTGAATSTASNGFNITSGCFAVNGTCISGGSASWGSITGTLSSQSDLQAAFDARLTLANWYATTTDALAQGSTNKYWSNTLFDNRLAATTTLPSLTTLANLATVGTITGGTWSGLFGAVSGANLTNLTAANIAAGTAGIDISGNAATVTNGVYTSTFNGLFDNRLAATTTLANITTVGTLMSLGVTGQTTLGNASSSQFSVFNKAYFGGTATTSVDSAGIVTLAGLGTAAGSFLAVNPSGQIIATTTPSSGGSGTVTSVAAGTGLSGGTITTSGTISLNLANANTWSALQLFSANASSTQFSNFGKAYFGGTATTTIDSAGNVVIPSGSSLTVSNLSGAVSASGGVLSAGTLAVTNGGTGVTTSTGTGDVVLSASPTFSGTANFSKAAFGSGLGDKIYLYSNSYGLGVESGGYLTNWAGSYYRWRIGGTSATTGTETMTLTPSALTVSTSIVATGNATIGGTLGVTGLTTLTNASTTQISSTGSTYLATAGGKVGIGTSTPYAKFSVWGTGTGTNLLSEWVNSASTTVASIFENGTTYFLGNVGVGTTSPFRKFSVTDTVATAQTAIAYDATRYADLRVDSSGDFNIGPSGGDVFLNNDNMWVCTGGTIDVNGCPSGTPTGAGNIIVENKLAIGTTTAAYKLVIETQDSSTNFLQIASTTAQSLLVMNANGNIGIATSSPFAKLSLGANSAIVTTENSLTDSATVAINWLDGNQQKVTLGGNRTITFANYTAGAILRLVVCQDATGSRTITWPAVVRWQGGSAPTLTTTANQCDLVSFVGTNATSSLVVFGAAALAF